MTMGPAVLEIVNPNQFGTTPKLKAIDGIGAAVRIVLLDYKKAFDLIDHSILADMIYSLHIPRGVACWVCDFLMNRPQHVLSSWMIASPSGG